MLCRCSVFYCSDGASAILNYKIAEQRHAILYCFEMFQVRHVSFKYISFPFLLLTSFPLSSLFLLCSFHSVTCSNITRFTINLSHIKEYRKFNSTCLDQHRKISLYHLYLLLCFVSLWIHIFCFMFYNTFVL